jgi:hypothetical protein
MEFVVRKTQSLSNLHITEVELVGDRCPSIHCVSPHHAEQYGMLASTLIRVEESLNQFMARVVGNDRQHFARWLIDSGAMSRDQFAELWARYQDMGDC